MANEPVTTICGNTAADVDLRFLPSGVAVAQVTVIQTPRTKRGDTWEDGEPIAVRCSIWRDAAENAVQSYPKGCRVVVTGRLKVSAWEKDGVRRTGLEMDVEDIGASSKFATVEIRKVQRSGGGGFGTPRPTGTDQIRTAADDPWGAAPAAVGAGQDETDPPF